MANIGFRILRMIGTSSDSVVACCFEATGRSSTVQGLMAHRVKVSRDFASGCLKNQNLARKTCTVVLDCHLDSCKVARRIEHF